MRRDCSTWMLQRLAASCLLIHGKEKISTATPEAISTYLNGPGSLPYPRTWVGKTLAFQVSFACYLTKSEISMLRLLSSLKEQWDRNWLRNGIVDCCVAWEALAVTQHWCENVILWRTPSEQPLTEPRPHTKDHDGHIRILCGRMDREGAGEEGNVWISVVELEHESKLCKGETDEMKMLRRKGTSGNCKWWQSEAVLVGRRGNLIVFVKDLLIIGCNTKNLESSGSYLWWLEWSRMDDKGDWWEDWFDDGNDTIIWWVLMELVDLSLVSVLLKIPTYGRPKQLRRSRLYFWCSEWSRMMEKDDLWQVSDCDVIDAVAKRKRCLEGSCILWNKWIWKLLAWFSAVDSGHVWWNLFVCLQ